LIEHDLRANAARLSRGKPVATPDQAEGSLFRMMLEVANRHVLQHLMTAPTAGNRLLAERARERIQSKA